MAEFVVGGKVTIDASGAEKSVGSIKQQLREAQKELLAVSEKFGATSTQAAAAAKKVAGFKDAIGDAKLLSDAFNPDEKFKAFSNSLQGVVGGFAAVQGAQALFGVKSEELEKTLVKVQGAMALSQGLNSVLSAKDAFVALGAQIKNAAIFQEGYALATKAATAIQSAFGIAVESTSVGFKVLRGAIISTGIGALVVGIGLLIEKIIDWTSNTNKQVSAEDALKIKEKELEQQIKKTNDEIQNRNEIDDYLLKTTLNNAKSRGASVKELKKIEDDYWTNKKLNAQEDLDNAQKDLDNLRSSGVTKGELYDKQLAQYNKILDEYHKVNQQSNIRDSEESVKNYEKKKGKDDEFAKQRKDDNKKYNDEIRKLQEDNFLATLKDEDARNIARIELDTKNKIKEINASKASADVKAALIKQIELKASNDIIAINDAKNKKLAEANQNALDQAQALADENYLHTITNENDRAKAKADMDYQKHIEDVNKMKVDEFEKNSLLQQYAIQHQNAITDIEAKAHEDRKKQDEAAYLAKQQNLQDIGGLVGQLAGIVGESTSMGKALTLAQIGIDTAAAISALTRNSEANPANAFTGGIAGTIQFATGLIKILANIAKAKQILSQSTAPGMKGSSGGGGSISAPSAPIPPQLQTTTLNQGQIQQMGNAAVRSFVLESDVSGNQERIRRLNRAARIS